MLSWMLAGGMIGLDAPTVTVSAAAQVFANGGGGGEGSHLNTGPAGNGKDPSTATVPASNPGQL